MSRVKTPHAVRAAAILVILAAGCRASSPLTSSRPSRPASAPAIATPQPKDLSPDGAGIGTLSSMMTASLTRGARGMRA
jgi:hypothetical protein